MLALALCSTLTAASGGGTVEGVVLVVCACLEALIDDEDSPNDFLDRPTAAIRRELPLLLFSTRSFSVRAGVDGADDEVAELFPVPSDSDAIVMVLGGSTVRRCCTLGGVIVDAFADGVELDEDDDVTLRSRCAAAAATAEAADPSSKDPRFRLPVRAFGSENGLSLYYINMKL